MNQLKRNTNRSKSVQIGRGGTRGKTSGHGHKGQKQHGRHGIRPEIRDMIKKLPKLRGRGVNSNKTIQTPNQVFSIERLDKIFKDGDTINPTTLFEKGMVHRKKGKMPRVKILSGGETKKKFTIERCEVSKSALKKIEAAGGTAVEMKKVTPKKEKKEEKAAPKKKVEKKDDDKKKDVEKKAPTKKK